MFLRSFAISLPSFDCGISYFPASRMLSIRPHQQVKTIIIEIRSKFFFVHRLDISTKCRHQDVQLDHDELASPRPFDILIFEAQRGIAAGAMPTEVQWLRARAIHAYFHGRCLSFTV